MLNLTNKTASSSRWFIIINYINCDKNGIVADSHQSLGIHCFL